MRHLTRELVVLAVASLALFATACNKGPAEAALKAAEQALAAAEADLERYEPDELASLRGAIAVAKGELEKGHYTEALKTAQDLPGKVEAAVAVATRKKDALTVTWTEVSAGLPGAVQAITDKMGALTAAKALPGAMTSERLASYESELSSITRAWNDASSAFQGGDIPRAVQAARDAKARAEVLAGALGLTPAPPAVAAK